MITIEANQHAERIAHGTWSRGWYFFFQYWVPTALPIAYPIMTRAFVVVPEIPMYRWDLEGLILGIWRNSRFVWPAVTAPTHASMTTKGAIEVTVNSSQWTQSRSKQKKQTHSKSNKRIIGHTSHSEERSRESSQESQRNKPEHQSTLSHSSNRWQKLQCKRWRRLFRGDGKRVIRLFE